MKTHITLLLTLGSLLFLAPVAAFAQADEGALPPKSIDAEPGFEADPAPGFEDDSGDATSGDAANLPARGFDALDLGSAIDLSNGDGVSSVKKGHGLTIASPDRSAVARGQFTRRASKESPELVTITPERGLEVYRGKSSYIRDRHVTPMTKAEREALGIDHVGKPVQLVRDGSSQFLVWRKDKDIRGDVVYKLTVYKVIGNYMGRVLDHTVGRVDPKTKKPVLTSQVSVLTSGTQVRIKVTPVKSGALQSSKARVLEWDMWHGEFVVPMVAPTAPRRSANLNF